MALLPERPDMRLSAPVGVTMPPETRRLVFLVTAAVFINYIDRGNLATAAPLMQDDLHLSATQIGVLLSAFYFGYVPLMPVIGWVAERWGAHRVLAASVALWSLATLLTGFAGTFLVLLALRILLGVGESAAFPCSSKVLAAAVAPSLLGRANGIFSFGYLVGPAVGTLVGGYLMSAFSWRPVFILFGALSLLWLLPWRSVAHAKATGGDTADPAGQPATLDILRERGLWGASMGHFALNYVYYFILSWLPFYLVKSRGFSLTAMAQVASWAYLLNALCALGMGWVADRWIRNGASHTLVYKGTMTVTHLVTMACMAGMLLLPQTGCIAALFLFNIVSGCSSQGIFVVPQVMAGPRAAGRWVGVQNAMGNVAGLIAPVLTGALLDRYGGFEWAFGMAAAVNIIGLVGWLVVLPQVKPRVWSTADDPHSAVTAPAGGHS